MKIESVMIWQNGQQKEANNFVLAIVNDNLSTSCTFAYYLQNVTEVEVTAAIPASDMGPAYPAQYTEIVDQLSSGNLILQGEEYQTWDADTSANQWAYNWAAGQLNLVLIPE
jgi:hypothetical protein